MRKVLRGALVAITPIILLIAGTPSSAQEVQERLAPVMVVLDASGSMKAADPSGGTRMDAAKRAMHTLIDSVPEDAELGLTVYGTETGNSPADKEAGCQDVRTLRDVAVIDKKALRRDVDAISPSGYTPIGTSLRHAAGELPDDDKRAVVLISDGEDTCAPPPPCDVARELSAGGTDLIVHTVGFRVGGKARGELKCVAETTGGTYTEAPDSKSLEDALPTITERALRSYQAQGMQIDGTSTTDNAPEIKPGQFVDSIDYPGTKNYRLNVPEGMTARIAATQVWPSDDTISIGSRETLMAQLADSGGQECASHGRSAPNAWQGPVTATARWTNDRDSTCEPGPDGEVTLTVERSGSLDSAPSHQLELMVIFEPPTEGYTGPSAVDSGDVVDYTAPKEGQPQPVTGSGSFNDATELDGPGRYTDVVQQGEWVAYRIWVDWGQALTYQLELGANAGSGPAGVSTEIYGPDRTAYSDFGSAARSSGVYVGETLTLDPAGTTEVLYNNRENGDAPDLAGWHYLTFYLENRGGSDDITVDLSVQVVGEKIDPPAYSALDGHPPSPVTNAQNEQEREQDQQSKPEQKQPIGVTGDSSSAGPLWLWFAAGGGLLGWIGVLVLVLGLRRRRLRAQSRQQRY